MQVYIFNDIMLLSVSKYVSLISIFFLLSSFLVGRYILYYTLYIGPKYLNTCHFWCNDAY